MRILNESRKGITLISLVITIVVLLILTSIATYSGIEVIKSSKLTTFTTEMKIMQTQVNELYQRYKNGDNTVLDIGKDLGSVLQQANKAFNASGITEQSEYRYFDQNTIKDVLKIEGVEGEFFVNIKERSVVSYEGFKYEGKTYYTLDQLPNGLYNVEYNDKNINMDKPTFDTSVEKVSEGKWRVTVSNIQYDGYINNWKVNYKLEGQDFWNTTEDLSFIATESGEYALRLINGNIKSDEKIITVKQGEILPAEYQQVEYIKSTGTQYIDTGFIPNSNTTIEMKASNVPTSTACLYCARTDYKENTFSAFLINGSSLRVDYYDTQYEKLMTVTSDTAYIYKQDKNLIYINEELIKTLTETEFDTMYNMYLLASHRRGTNLDNIGDVRLYYCKIWDDGTLIRDMIPCYRKSDNEIGMYDTVNNKFYTNQGTGEFVIPIPIPNQYQQVEYIKSTGTQYIDTGIFMDNNISIKGKNDIGNGTLMGVQDEENCFAIASAMNREYFRYFKDEGKEITINAIPYEFAIKNNELYVNGSLVYAETNYSEYTFHSSLYLFARNIANNEGGYMPDSAYGSRTIYYIKIYNGDNNIVRNFIPCYRKSDNEIGMYDIVNNKFYTNQGTGTFEKGNNV